MQRGMKSKNMLKEVKTMSITDKLTDKLKEKIVAVGLAGALLTAPVTARALTAPDADPKAVETSLTDTATVESVTSDIDDGYSKKISFRDWKRPTTLGRWGMVGDMIDVYREHMRNEHGLECKNQPPIVDFYSDPENEYITVKVSYERCEKNLERLKGF